MKKKAVACAGFAWLLLMVSAGGALAAEPGDVRYKGAVYSSAEFDEILVPLHEAGVSLQFLMLPDDSMLAVPTGAQLVKAFQRHYGVTPPAELFAEDTEENPIGTALRERRAWRMSAKMLMATDNCPNIHNNTSRIWKHDNCGGDYLSSYGTDQVGNLGNYGHNDTTSSIQVGGNVDYFRGYWNSGFDGSVLNIYGNGDGTDKNWGAPALGTWNDEISSYKTACSSC